MKSKSLIWIIINKKINMCVIFIMISLIFYPLRVSNINVKNIDLEKGKIFLGNTKIIRNR